MKELKQMIVNNLLDEYNLDDAIRSVDESEIHIKGNNINVVWSNGKTNDYKIEVTESLILIK